MKRTDHARLVGIGREVPDYVDKPRTFGRVTTDHDAIARQLRGEPVVLGEPDRAAYKAAPHAFVGTGRYCGRCNRLASRPPHQEIAR